MQRQNLGVNPAGQGTPRIGAFNAGFTPIPELEDVDAELAENARVAAEEEAYRFVRFKQYLDSVWHTGCTRFCLENSAVPGQ